MCGDLVVQIVRQSTQSSVPLLPCHSDLAAADVDEELEEEQVDVEDPDTIN